MAIRNISEHTANKNVFTPPIITHTLWKQLLQMFLDGGIIAKQLEEYVENDSDPAEKLLMKSLLDINEVGKELKYFFENQKHTTPIITPRIWSALKEYYQLGTYLARQAEQFAVSDKALLSRFKAAVNVAERSFCVTENDLNDFFSQDPYKK